MGLNLSAINDKSTIKTGRQSNGNRQFHIHNYIVKNTGKCDRKTVSDWLFTEEFGVGPYQEDQEAELVAKMVIYKKAVKVALGTNKASINRNDELTHSIEENDKGVLVATEKA